MSAPNPSPERPPELWTVLDILKWTTAFFTKQAVDSPRLAAELLLAHILGVERIQLYVQYDRPLDAPERAAFRELVKRRAAGEPVQYILEAQEFWSIPLRVTRGALVPRPDTEVLVEEALAHARALAGPDGDGLRIADVGTGTGAIAIALAKELPGARVFAGDIAAVPLALAPDNARAAGVADRVTVCAGPGLAPLWEAADRAPFHLVCSNPPYIRAAAMAGLMREVRDWEPHEALAAGPDGLDVLRPLVAEVLAPGRLAPGGAALFEIGDADQAATVAAWLSAGGLIDARVRDDYASNPRVVLATRPAAAAHAVPTPP